MKITDKIQTIGEIEVINFIKESQERDDMLLIDARLPDWFLQMSIPTAENIPFTYFNKDKYPDDFYDVLDMIGVKEVSKGKYDFTQAKELVLFCNGAWCPQSTFAIENLIKIGYPEEKISWYRGGMYSWKMLNLTTTSE
ncbi:MAG: rhodanese-like domain-containing protein [Halarcobacter ebronensis]